MDDVRHDREQCPVCTSTENGKIQHLATGGLATGWGPRPQSIAQAFDQQMAQQEQLKKIFDGTTPVDPEILKLEGDVSTLRVYNSKLLAEKSGLETRIANLKRQLDDNEKAFRSKFHECEQLEQRNATLKQVIRDLLEDDDGE